MNYEIKAIEKVCKGEIIQYVKHSDIEVCKYHLTIDRAVKKTKIQNVREKKLIHRMARDTNDFMYNMIYIFGYSEVKNGISF